MFHRIVVGIDGDEGGQDALVLADALAAANADIVLTCAFPAEFSVSDGATHLVREAAQLMVEQAAGSDPRHRVRVIEDWSPGRALHHAADEVHADLIVIGSSRRGALGRVLLGDVSRSTLQGAPCAVVVAPRGMRERPASAIATIGVGVNDTRESDAALAVAAELAAETGATLRLLNAPIFPTVLPSTYPLAFDWREVEAEKRRAAEEAIAAVAEGLEVPVEAEVVFDNPGRALEAMSDRVDLIVAGSRGWGAFRRVVLGSTTDRLTHHARCPVLVVPSPVAERDLARA